MFEMGTGVTPPAWPPGILSVSREALGVRREVIPKNQNPLRLTLHASRALKTVSTRGKLIVKPHGRLVLVGYRPYGPSTSSLSNS